LSLWAGFARRWLDLPAPRTRTLHSREWLATRDGTRLATAVVRPQGTDARTTVIVRSAASIGAARSPVRAAARLLAEQGHAVVIQTCRGLHSSEGHFQPFADEARDGEDLLEWATRQPWFRRPLVLAGFGYAGHAAWAGLSGDLPIDGLIVGFAARDLYAWLHCDRALRLEAALELAVGLSVADSQPSRSPDLARALRYRPLREADRVALRRIPWWREWLDHPRRDAYWEERTPRPTQRPGAALLIGAFGHPTLEAQLGDCTGLREASDSQSPVRLLVGAWGDDSGTRRERRRRAAALRREGARAILDFLDALYEGRGHGSPVRGFVAGAERWRDAAVWPPADARERLFHLAGDGRAGDGRAAANAPGELRDDPPDEQAADPYLYDPADAPSWASELRAAPPRADVLRYTSAPFDGGLEIAGSPRVDLFAASDAPRTDFAVRLLAIAPDGEAIAISQGLARDALRERTPEPTGSIEIALSPLWRQLAPGTRLRLEVSSSGFPEYDRHSNTREAPMRATDGDGVVALQHLWHDSRHPSCLRLPVLQPL
jgi:putative CocE/NonD family hydrolase